MIREAKNPLIMVSSGANRKGVAEELGNFATKTGIYLVHTQMGKSVVPMAAFTVSLRSESIPEIISTVESMDLM